MLGSVALSLASAEVGPDSRQEDNGPDLRAKPKDDEANQGNGPEHGHMFAVVHFLALQSNESLVAVTVGFEPTVRFHAHNFSRVAPSAARTRHRESA